MFSSFFYHTSNCRLFLIFFFLVFRNVFILYLLQKTFLFVCLFFSFQLHFFRHFNIILVKICLFEKKLKPSLFIVNSVSCKYIKKHDLMIVKLNYFFLYPQLQITKKMYFAVPLRVEEASDSIIVLSNLVSSLIFLSLLFDFLTC